MPDIRDLLFASIADHEVTATVVADQAGTIAAVEAAASVAAEVGLTVLDVVAAGTTVSVGDVVMTVVGGPKAIALGEERLLGVLAKPSGIATAARCFVDRAGPSLRVVAGAWKKVPAAVKADTRAAIATGGAELRIRPFPFVYLDKNYVTMLGGVRAALDAADLPGHGKVIQLRDPADACLAAACGADVVFVDTGRVADVVAAGAALRAAGLRRDVELAFAGNVGLADLDRLRRLDLDIVDVGRAIVDAPLLDLHLEVRP